MKKIILISLLIFFGLITSQAQNYETIGILQPLPIKKTEKSKIKAEENHFEPYGVDFDARTEAVNLPNLTTGFLLIVNIPNRELAFEDKNENSEAYVKIYGRVMSEDKKMGGIFEEKLLIKQNKTTIDKAVKTLITYRKIFELPEGKYKIDILVKDDNTGYRGIQSLKFEISDSKSPQNAAF